MKTNIKTTFYVFIFGSVYAIYLIMTVDMSYFGIFLINLLLQDFTTYDTNCLGF